MAQPDPQKSPEPGEPDPRRGALLGLLVTVALIIIGLILVKVLGDSGRLQDCEMSGRTNCAPIDTSSQQ
jgi:hypothetical protein